MTKAEWVRVAAAALQDPAPLMARVLRIVRKGGGGGSVIPLVANPAQRRIHAEVVRLRAAGLPPRILVVKARQGGVSTWSAGYCVATALTMPHTVALQVAHVERVVHQLLDKARLMIDRLPRGLRVRLGVHRQDRLHLTALRCADGEIGLRSQVLIGSASGHAMWRGTTIQTCHVSELAYCPNPSDTLLGVLQAVPLLPETLVLIESTANGRGDALHDEWCRATAGESGFAPVFIPWFLLDDAHLPVPDGFVRTDEEQEWVTQLGLTDRQLQWRRYVLYTQCRGNRDLFCQEFPTTADEAFLFTGRPAFDTQLLTLMKTEAPTPVRFHVDVTTGHQTPHPTGPLSVYHPPIPSHDYVVGIDPSAGLAGGDPACCQVFDRTTETQVAVWHGYLTPQALAQVARHLGTAYNTALLAPEVTGGHGFAVIEELKFQRYPRLYVWQRVDRVRHATSNFFGWDTNSRTRPLLTDTLTAALAEGRCRLLDAPTLDEALAFQYVSPTRAEGIGAHDDRIMAFLIALRVHYEWPMPATGLPPRLGLLEPTPPQAPVPSACSPHDAHIWDLVEREQAGLGLPSSARTAYDTPDQYGSEDAWPDMALW